MNEMLSGPQWMQNGPESPITNDPSIIENMRRHQSTLIANKSHLNNPVEIDTTDLKTSESLVPRPGLTVKHPIKDTNKYKEFGESRFRKLDKLSN